MSEGEKDEEGAGIQKSLIFFITCQTSIFHHLPNIYFLSPAKHLLPLCRPPGAGKCLWKMSEQ